MSHFTVGIFTTAGADIEAHIEKVLAPYDEQLEVPEYAHKCYCVGKVAEHAGYELANATYGTWKDKKDAFWEMMKRNYPHLNSFANDDDEKKIDELWKAFTGDFNEKHSALVEATAKAHPLYDKPEPACDECKGTGTYQSNYNPDSKWDWYVVGGRWDGALLEIPYTDGKSHEERQYLHNNSLPVRKLIERYENTGELFTFFALVTPDGAWLEKARMGWFAMTSDEKEPDTWQEATLNLYRAHIDCNITMVDAHI
jgi:hypothetical protein